MSHEPAVFGIEVDVALRRPPTVDATTYHLVATDRGEVDAHLQAIETATLTRPVVMAVGCRTVWVEV